MDNNMLRISSQVSIPENEIEMTFIRAQGSGGQNVNKVSTAVHLRFDFLASSLPDFYKERLLKLRDHRITQEGLVIIKAQRYRSQEKNREDALLRLQELVQSVAVIQKKRLPTKPSKAAKARRIGEKSQHGKTKALRRKVSGADD